MLIRTPELEDVPELLHRIQSLMPIKAAARTCVLSKSWLHAWSTIPTLRFGESLISVSSEEQQNHLKLIDRTILRYIRDNISIESFDVQINERIHESVSFAEKWIQLVASKSCLKELCVRISSLQSPEEFTLAHEMFSGKNLDTIRIEYNGSSCVSVRMSSNLVINCVFLRILELIKVHISQKVLGNILSTCSLLEKIHICTREGFKTIKVKNLPRLSELIIISGVQNDLLEIEGVPSLRLLRYCLAKDRPIPLPLITYSLQSVTQLQLHGVIVDDIFWDMIKSSFNCLEILYVKMRCPRLEKMNITSVSLKRLILLLLSDNAQLDFQVYASNLIYFGYQGRRIPMLSFSTIVPEKVKLKHMLWNPIDHSFFLKMRETLNLSSKFDIEIIQASLCQNYVTYINIDDLRRRVLFPAMNVQELSFRKESDGRLLQHSKFFDACFSICHPNYVKAFHFKPVKDKPYFCESLVRTMMEKKTCGLTDVEIRNPSTRKWEPVTSSWRSFLDPLADSCSVKFKLSWSSE